MALGPSVNNNLATMTFGKRIINGDQPVIYPYKLSALPLPLTQNYSVGTLLALDSSNPLRMVIYDSTAQAAKPFKCIHFDETAPAPINGIVAGLVSCAINSRSTTQWKYSQLTGANGTTVDIDFLVTNGFADIVWLNGQTGTAEKFIQFKGMGTGA